MTQLTTDNIIKITIGVIVLAFVILGAVLSFNNYIKPFFDNLFPNEEEEQVDINTPYYQNLMKNLIAFLDKDGIINFVGQNSQIKDFRIEGEHIRKIKKGNWYYAWLNSKDPKVGEIVERIIKIDSKYRSDSVLMTLNDAEYIEQTGGIYKI